MTDQSAPERPSLRVVGGFEAREERARRGSTFVCTWCALRFATKTDLDEHRMTSVECRANQKVSSPLQTRYGDADMVWTQPGEATLHRVRAATCQHAAPRARLVDAAGDTIGYQCGYCYGVLPQNLPGAED
jgi:hypothetical protein